MENIVISLIIICIVGSAGLYIYKAKKRGQKCIGCPYAKTCATKQCSSEIYENN